MQPTWNQPTTPQPRQRPKWLTGWRLALTGTLAVLALCCGGVTAIGLFVDDPAGKNTPKQAATAAPFIAPTSTLPVTTDPTPELTTPPPTTVPAPSKTTVRPTPKRTTAAPKPKPKVSTSRPRPKPTRTRTTSSQSGVHPGAFCSPVGARGTTSKGTAMRCTRKAGEDRARWRQA